MRNPIDTLQRVRKEQLSAFFDGDDGKLRPYDTPEWRERRDEIIGDECTWCGEDEKTLQVHHTLATPQWGREWIHATDGAFVQSDAYKPQYTIDREECPSCGLRDYYARKTKDPTYRCNECKTAFNELTTVSGLDAVTSESYDTKPYVTEEFYTAKAEWLLSNQDVALDAFRERFAECTEEYLTTDEVITICKRCHYLEEQTRKVRCEECGENFHPRHYDICFDCAIDKKGLKQCSTCEDGWYQPEKYDACSECR